MQEKCSHAFLLKMFKMLKYGNVLEMLFVLSLTLCETMKDKNVPVFSCLSSTKGPSEVHFSSLTLCAAQVKQKVE